MRLIFSRQKYCFPSSVFIIICFLAYPRSGLSETRPSYNTSSGFFVKNGRLYDARGNRFIPRGLNSTHGWDDWSAGDKATRSLDNISKLGFNSIRIVWAASKGDWGFPKKNNLLKGIIQECIKHHMVPMPELHDWTGGGNSGEIAKAANYWKNNAGLVNSFEKHILVNIANEWGNGSTSDKQWRDAYKKAIATIRGAGIKATLIIDATEWAKKIGPIKAYGRELLNSDPQKNIVFSTHYYCGAGESVSEINAHLNWAAGTNEICLLVGEFAHTHPRYGGGGGTCDVKEKAIVEACKRNGQGYYWWAWMNGQFSLAKSFEASSSGQLTSIGKWLVFDSNAGIKATSKKATIFTGENPGPDTPPDTSDTPEEPRDTTTKPQTTSADFSAPHVRLTFGDGAVEGWISGNAFAQGGQSFTFSGAVSTDAQSDAAPEAVYRSVYHRGNTTDDLRFDFPEVADGRYILRFHVADAFGGRAIDILAEGTLVVENLDPITEAGGEMKAVVKEASVNVSDGNGLQIGLTDDRAEPKDVFLGGLEIIAEAATRTSFAAALHGGARASASSAPVYFIATGRAVRRTPDCGTSVPEVIIARKGSVVFQRKIIR